jgi:hypothetical protein
MAGAPPALLPAAPTTLGAPALGAPAALGVPAAPAKDWFEVPGFSAEAEHAAKQAKIDKATERLSMK